jgi:hypothetical protein
MARDGASMLGQFQRNKGEKETMSQLGFGAMLGMLRDNSEDVKILKDRLGKTIEKVWVKDDYLSFKFTDGSTMNLYDSGQSCCEERFMTCDDDLTQFVGDILLDVDLSDVVECEGRDDANEVQFLRVKTDKGMINVANHVEHNGYYGGFSISISGTEAERNDDEK